MNKRVNYHLPGLFEFYEFYQVFLPLYHQHREYFYDWCSIASIYGAPADSIWNGGRISESIADPKKVLELMEAYGISARLTFSNSLLKPEHLSDRRCNELCELFSDGRMQNGVIVHSDLLKEYLRRTYPKLYLISSTTKVLTRWKEVQRELQDPAFSYVVPDFRLNKAMVLWDTLAEANRDKVEFLCNECCYFGCADRRMCYETVSMQNLGIDCEDFICRAPNGNEGYRFSRAMENPGFIRVDDILNGYLPAGYSNFKIEGRGLGTAILLEFLLYYLTKPEYQLRVREEIYLDAMLDLF